MIDYRAQLMGAIKAVVIQSPTQFSWFGKRSPPLWPHVKRVITPGSARSYLYYTLQSTLYNHFYCMGEATPIKIGAFVNAENLSPDPAYIAQLSEANTGQGYWSAGWERVGLDDLGANLVAARRNDLLVLTREGDYRPGNTEETAVQEVQNLQLYFPKELPFVSPGFYMAVSDIDFDVRGSDVSSSDTRAPGSPLVRLYWHVTPVGAPRLMSLVTKALNRAEIPFNFKVVNNPDRLTRCDSAVLYIRRANYAKVAKLLSPIYAQLSTEMRSAVPALTLPLAPGLGLAEDPGGGDSFGLHRCGLLAEGLIRAYEAGKHSLGERLEAVVEAFGEAGILLERPYLGMGSSERFAFDIGDLPTRSTQNARTHPQIERPHVEIARQLIRDAIWYDGMCSWLGTEVRARNNHGASVLREEWRALGPDLYTGTAGVALFLAEYAAITGAKDADKAALASIRHSFHRADSIPAFARPGLYTGQMGIALAGVRIGNILSDAEAVARALDLARRCSSEEHPGHEHDLLGGSAGAIVASLVLAQTFDEPSLRDYAVRLGDGLLASARREQQGGVEMLSWPQIASKTAAPLTGFSHGTAGIAYALLELGYAVDEPRYMQAAESAFSYEARWYNPEMGNWPDFREVAPSQKVLARTNLFPYEAFWCHGAPGIALSRLRAHALTGDILRYNEALTALQTTERAVHDDILYASGNYSLCHGLTGNASILLEADRMFHLPETRALAVQVAEEGERRRLADGAWECGTGGKHGAQAPGLMLGLAGMGHFYLRLAHPDVPSVLFINPETWAPTRI